MTALIIFLVSYLGIAMGRIPGLTVDRVGIAILGAIAMVAFGAVSPQEAVRCIDFPTLCLLYGLMIISAQLRLGGFYTAAAEKVLNFSDRPRLFLLVSMLLSAVMSALLANDIICFAMAPILAYSLKRAGLNPVPFLLGLAMSSNIGSASTLIGNPQNMLIGQVGRLSFQAFFLWAFIPSFISLVAAFGIIIIFYGQNLLVEKIEIMDENGLEWPQFDGWQTGKGIVAVAVLVGLYLTDIPRDLSTLTVAGSLLLSRKIKSREIMALVDWHLITLFCALFIIIHGITLADLPEQVLKFLSQKGFELTQPVFLTGVSVILSNLFSNVPAVMLVIPCLSKTIPDPWYILALSSTFAGNLFLLGSIANLIVVEKALGHGVLISFKEHARIGIPVTILSLLVLVGWTFLI
ncbi:MAG: anion transporter [Desulfobacter postgatei]|uniref:anion transporter n=1 Tax=Desulfobacter postgatei TaxID=2293 RepID=UPI0023F1E3BD|nr:anion transporter [Desulfobacter postgatei]MDD4273221.1 anion transporter [Desulfobacter postgatei]